LGNLGLENTPAWVQSEGMGMLALALFLAQVPGVLDFAEQAAALEREAGTLAEAGRYEDAERVQKHALGIWEQVARTRPVNLAERRAKANPPGRQITDARAMTK
jgi:hypothetical protein